MSRTSREPDQSDDERQGLVRVRRVRGEDDVGELAAQAVQEHHHGVHDDEGGEGAQAEEVQRPGGLLSAEQRA